MSKAAAVVFLVDDTKCRSGGAAEADDVIEAACGGCSATIT